MAQRPSALTVGMLMYNMYVELHKAKRGRLHRNESGLYVCLQYVLVTVRRQCCVCWGAWRRWVTSVSVPYSPAKAAWLPGGRVRHEVTARAAPCTPPASRGQPPSPPPRHLERHRKVGIRGTVKAKKSFQRKIIHPSPSAGQGAFVHVTVFF